MNTAVAEPASPSSSALAPGKGEYLCFRLGGEEYGIDKRKVQEIRGYEVSTRMVQAPPHVLGVQNLCGVVAPILDLRIRFGMADVVYDSQTVTLVLTVAHRVVGLVVDAVAGVVTLQGEDIRPASGLHGTIRHHCVIGIAAVEQGAQPRRLILIDIEQLMSANAMGLPVTQQA